jgi:hypothetical protein
MNLLSRKAKVLDFASSGSEKLDELLGGGLRTQEAVAICWTTAENLGGRWHSSQKLL